jgi:alpha-acetolactate decarboxylase
MANTFRLKRSAVQGKVPATTDLQTGELALNTYDGKLYTLKNDGTAAVVEIGATTPKSLIIAFS